MSMSTAPGSKQVRSSGCYTILMKFTFGAKIFFGALIVIVTFFVGLNLGKNIERFDKTYVPPAPTATQAPAPTTTELEKKSVVYKIYPMDECGVSFLTPSTFKKRKTPETELELYHEDDRIFLTCAANYIDEILEDIDLDSSDSATLEETELWITRNKDREQVLFEVSKPIAPLIRQTLDIL